MVRYRLDDLGWFQFEWLCQSLLKTALGLGVEAWGGRSDLGRDAYSRGPLPLDGPKSQTPGPFVFQAKFIAEANATGAKPEGHVRNAVSQESLRIRERLEEARIQEPSVYVLLTNAPLSAVLRTELVGMIEAVLPRTRVLTWGADDICSLLDSAPQIRVAFPQLLGLRDLAELLRTVVQKPLLERSTLALEQAAELANVFVPTTAYNKSLGKLAAHGFVVLTGPPEMGKTAIARMIGLAKLGEGWECYECTEPRDFLELRRGEQKQVFVADDAFGTTEYRPEIAYTWAKEMDRILRAVDGKHWLIWTSRPAPLHMALQKMHLQGRAEKFPRPSEILVDAAQLSRTEKALMLYRHAKAAGLESPAKDLVRQEAEPLIENPHFTPERVRRFVNEALPSLARGESGLEATRAALLQEIERPTVSMRKSFDALSIEHRQVLVAMLDAGDRRVSLESLREAHARLSGGASYLEQLADDLGAHFLRVSTNDRASVQYGFSERMSDDRTIEWMHPSWRDLVIERLSADSEARKSFLTRCGMNGFILALSGAGGPTGNRQTPLAVTPEDWRVLSETAQRLIIRGTSHDVWRLLVSVLETARRQTGSKGGSSVILRGAEADFVRKTLQACADKWKSDGSHALTSAVNLYLAISEYLSPLPPCPEFRPMWDLSWTASMEEMESFRPSDAEPFLAETDDWLGLAAVVMKYEPRFLRQVGFPSEYAPHFRQLLPLLTERAQLDKDLTSNDECRGEADRLGFLSHVVEGIAALFPDLENEVAEADQAICDRTQHIEREEERIQEREREKEAEQELEYREELERHVRMTSPDRIERPSARSVVPPKSSAFLDVDLGNLFKDL